MNCLYTKTESKDMSHSDLFWQNVQIGDIVEGLVVARLNHKNRSSQVGWLVKLDKHAYGTAHLKLSADGLRPGVRVYARILNLNRYEQKSWLEILRAKTPREGTSRTKAADQARKENPSYTWQSGLT